MRLKPHLRDLIDEYLAEYKTVVHPDYPLSLDGHKRAVELLRAIEAILMPIYNYESEEGE